MGGRAGDTGWCWLVSAHLKQLSSQRLHRQFERAPPRRRIEGRRAGDPGSLISNPARLKQTLGWEPRNADLDTIIAHALQWERKLAGLRRGA